MTQQREIRLIALDLDGTLLMDDKSVSPENQHALQEAADRGVLIAAASGRPFSSLPDNVLALPFLHYAITNNGAALYRVCDRSRLYGSRISAQQLQSILEMFPQMQGMEATYEKETFIDRVLVDEAEAYGMNRRAACYLRATRTSVDDIRSTLTANAGNGVLPDCVNLFFPAWEQEQRIAGYIHEIPEKIPGLYATTSFPHLLEISAAKDGKCDGLRWIADSHGFTREQIIAFGDGENDRDMIRFAGIGTAMGNAPDSVKKDAQMIAPTNEEHGVAAVLRDLGLCGRAGAAD